jgi:ABC-2 type transport system permease protein
MNWAGPIQIDEKLNKNRTVTTLLRSSPESWTASDGALVPDYNLYQEFGFATPTPTGPYKLGVIVEGKFVSHFQGKDSPLNKPAPEADPANPTPEKKEGEKKPTTASQFGGLLEKSPTSARIILISSSDFVDDQTLSFSASDGSTQYLNALQLLENSVDWSLEDRGLLSIRSRSNFNNTLAPVSRTTQAFIEYGNYALALIGLLALFFLWKARQKIRETQYAELLKA